MCVSVLQQSYPDQYLRLLGLMAVWLFVRSMRMDLRQSSLRCSSTMHLMLARRWSLLSRRDWVVRRCSGWPSAPVCATWHCRRVHCRSSRQHCIMMAHASSLQQPLLHWQRSMQCHGGQIRALITAWRRIHDSYSACRCAMLVAPRQWFSCAANIPDFGTASTALLLSWRPLFVLGVCTDGTWSNC